MNDELTPDTDDLEVNGATPAEDELDASFDLSADDAEAAEPEDEAEEIIDEFKDFIEHVNPEDFGG